MTQVNARIDKGIYDRLSKYSEITGVPVSRCIAEACETWLTCIAPTRIEAMQRVNQELGRVVASEHKRAENQVTRKTKWKTK